MLYRLSLTDDPAWDRAEIRHTVDLIAALETAAAKFAAASHDAGLESDGPDGGDMFSKGASALCATVPIWRAALEQCGAFPASGASASASSNAGAGPGPGAATSAAAAGGGGSSGGNGGYNGSGGAVTAAIGGSAGTAENEMGDVAGVYDVNPGMADMQTFDLMQEYLMMDFVDDAWPSNLFTWQSPQQ